MQQSERSTLSRLTQFRNQASHSFLLISDLIPFYFLSGIGNYWSVPKIEFRISYTYRYRDKRQAGGSEIGLNRLKKIPSLNLNLLIHERITCQFININSACLSLFILIPPYTFIYLATAYDTVLCRY